MVNKEDESIQNNMVISREEKTMLRVWTKKLGQKHYTRDGMTETLCGMPMLGNNYAGIIPENEQKECEECLKVLGEI